LAEITKQATIKITDNNEEIANYMNDTALSAENIRKVYL
jgi:hypothetical protein